MSKLFSCSFSECSRPAKANGGLCPPHQLQRSRFGSHGLKPLLIRRAPLAQRFWAKVDILENRASCWLWTGHRNQKGYGRIQVNGRGVQLAPRVSWELSNGPIPAGMFVLHRCDNPPCVNPGHLFTGTAHDNTADMMAKGRQNTDGLVLTPEQRRHVSRLGLEARWGVKSV